MRIGFSCPVTPGHLHPMITLARKLQTHGHDVFFLCIAEGEPMVRAAGLEFVPYGEEILPSGEMARRLQILSQLNGTEALQYAIKLFSDTCSAALEDGERAIRASQPDALVLDALSSGLWVVASYMGLPFVNVSNALHLDYSGKTPLCLYDWPHQEDPEAFARNTMGAKGFLQMMSPIVEVERAYANRVGLALDLDDPEARRSKLAHLTQTPKEFDFPASHWPAHFKHTGPLHDPALRPAVDFPWDKLTGEPLIYASMGTLQNGSEGIFQAIAAAAQTPGRQLVLSIGHNLDSEKLGPLAATTIVVRQAPQLDLLKRATLCITHAGLNTALESLSAGVPMVAIPITNDQPGVGARIAYTKTGVVVPLKELSVEKLRAAIETVLADPSYRENTQQIQQAIERTNGLQLAADIIEKTLGAALQTASQR
jgi:zeaxanthin glucosyltransferase